MDSTASSKVKITEEGVGARSLACITLGVEGCAGILGSGLERLINKSIIHMDVHKLNKLVSASWNIFGAQTSHGQTQIHKTHHNSDLREATTFPLIVFSLATGLAPKCYFVKFSKLRLSRL
jgi:hypothetical protein